MTLRTSLLVLVWSGAVSAQPWVELAAWKPPADQLRVSPKSTCSGLRALTGYEFSIISAKVVRTPKGDAEYCRVLGIVQPEIKFEVALPTSWHGRFLMIGNGGYAGENLEHVSRLMARDAAVDAGFLFAQTNTGHDSEVLGGA